MLIDSHIHLDAREFDADRAQLLAEAAQAGVAGYVIPAVAPFNFSIVRALAHSVPNAVYALGIHPMYVMPLNEEESLAATTTCPAWMPPSKSGFTLRNSSWRASLVCPSFCMYAARKTCCSNGCAR
jgi:Tat protein secretion system quality control protein TatD with DNase activity